MGVHAAHALNSEEPWPIQKNKQEQAMHYRRRLLAVACGWDNA